MPFEIVDIETKDDLQNIKIPVRFKIDDIRVCLKKTGDVLYIIPYHNVWKSLTDATNEFSDDFIEKRNQPGNQNREMFDE
jgi:antitoxin VapB